jgi:hypothetical protein
MPTRYVPFGIGPVGDAVSVAALSLSGPQKRVSSPKSVGRMSMMKGPMSPWRILEPIELRGPDIQSVEKLVTLSQSHEPIVRT